MTKVLLIDPAKPGRKDAPINELDHYVSILEQKIRNHLFGHFIKEEYDQRGIKDTYQDYPYIANLGLLMIGTVAKNAGHEVYYYQFTEQEDKSELDELISKSEVIGITAMNTTVDDAIDIAKRSKRINPNSQVVGGGPEFSNSKVNYMLNNPYFDVLFRGESEITFVQFLNDPKKISNLKRIKGINYR